MARDPGASRKKGLKVLYVKLGDDLANAHEDQWLLENHESAAPRGLTQIGEDQARS